MRIINIHRHRPGTDQGGFIFFKVSSLLLSIFSSFHAFSSCLSKRFFFPFQFHELCNSRHRASFWRKTEPFTPETYDRFISTADCSPIFVTRCTYVHEACRREHARWEHRVPSHPWAFRPIRSNSLEMIRRTWTFPWCVLPLTGGQVYQGGSSKYCYSKESKPHTTIATLPSEWGPSIINGSDGGRSSVQHGRRSVHPVFYRRARSSLQPPRNLVLVLPPCCNTGADDLAPPVRTRTLQTRIMLEGILSPRFFFFRNFSSFFLLSRSTMFRQIDGQSVKLARMHIGSVRSFSVELALPRCNYFFFFYNQTFNCHFQIKKRFQSSVYSFKSYRIIFHFTERQKIKLSVSRKTDLFS